MRTLMFAAALLLGMPAGAGQQYTDYADPVFATYPKPAPGSDTAQVRKFRITVLSDMAVNFATHGEWGYAALVDGVDAEGKPFSILFDTGAETGTVWYNIQRLRDPDDPSQNLVKKVCSTGIVLLSHNHFDHTAGLLTLRRECMAKGYDEALRTAYLGGPEALWLRENRTFRNPDGTHPNNNYLLHPSGPGPADDPSRGTIEEQYRALGGSFVFAEVPRQLFAGVWTSGKVHRASGERAFWQYGEQGPMIHDDNEYHDTVPEDHGLVINTVSGLVTVTGCGHAGVVNVVRHASEWVVAGNRPVTAVAGGMHLFVSNVADLEIVRKGLEDAGVKYLLGSHCTGFETVVWLREKMGMDPANAVMGTVGTMFQTDPRDAAKLEVAWLPGGMINRHPAKVR